MLERTGLQPQESLCGFGKTEAGNAEKEPE